MKKRHVFDEAFKRMAVDLSYAKGSVQEAAHELGIDSSPVQTPPTASGLSQEQQLIRRLQKELKEAELERDILKKAVSIFSRGDRKSSDL